jgi:hypothetical protein
MSKRPKSSKKNRFPKGWNEAKVRQVIAHHENQSEEEAAAEDDKLFANVRSTYMQIPVKLVPAVRKLLARRAG